MWMGPKNRIFALGLAAAALGACDNVSPTTGNAESALGSAAGALVRLEMASTVAVLLDEIPAGAERESAARSALAQSTTFWTNRAARQTKLAGYRLIFRAGFYPGTTKASLPLPPKPAWDIELVGKAKRTTFNGHDVVAIPYRFSSYQVTSATSPADAEPALAAIGGTWDEPFQFPIDPELLLQRTGFACMDEFEFPPSSVFSENVDYYYDQTCGVETPDTSACHITHFPGESCVDALSRHVGMVSTTMRFRRVGYAPGIAKRYRVGSNTNPNGADLNVVTDYMTDEHAFYYQYFDANSCDIEEGTVAKQGWRRLLSFSATVRNDGTQPLHIGDPRDAQNPWVKSNVFEFSKCHAHYHFSHYGNFNYNGAPGRKRAFCLEDTNRYRNDENTPLTAIHQTCEFQGIGAGWGDEYNYGLPGQWVDVTDVDTTHPHDLTFESNADQFMCEGQTLDQNGNPVDPLDLAHIAFDPTAFVNDNGLPVSRIRCKFPNGWNAGNLGSISVSSPGGSFVTDDCRPGLMGPLRDCGFASAKTALRSCTPGQTVNLVCTVKGAPQVLRICESSEALNTGVACAFNDAAANTLVDGHATAVAFTCPAVRDAANPGTGGYSVYQAPLLPWELQNPAPPITCAGW